MFSITSSTIVGIQAVPIDVEAHVSMGLTHFQIVGLPDAGVKESRERIRAAMKQSGYSFPRGRVTVNLAPANIRKEGAGFDLPIALSILIATGQIPAQASQNAVFLGELSLQGMVRPVQGALNASVMAKATKRLCVYVPKENVQEALAVEGIEVFSIGSLKELVDHLLNFARLEPQKPDHKPQNASYSSDFTFIKGQELAKRGLEIAASGGHNILLTGPPGTGKTLLARAFPSILPDLSYSESIETTSIASVAGELRPEQGLIRTRPFRSPHHSASAVSLVGGGAWPKPGEVSLAHRGVLFLDELPEFSRFALEHLRQPLEDGSVTITRSAGSIQFPARFLLIASMNPCPCGYLTDPTRACQCTSSQIQRYQKRISGPLLDRFDLMIEVPKLTSQTLLDSSVAETSECIRTRVTKARDIQLHRFETMPYLLNSEILPKDLDSCCPLSPDGKRLVELALNQHKLTPRGFSRVKKVSRTIADLAGVERIEDVHVAEALQFREQTVFVS